MVGVALLLVACGDDSASTGGAGSIGGAGGAPIGGAGGAAGAEQGGAGGTAPTGCSPFDDPPTCEEGTHCVVVDDSLGLEGGTACITPGDTPDFAICAEDAECMAGSMCDRSMNVCKPVCELDSDCPEPNGVCFAAVTSAGLAIPGLDLCLAGCEPISGTVCDDATGPVNCVFRPEGEAFDCTPAGEGIEGTPCETHDECSTGFGCLEEGKSSYCLRWCFENGGGFCTDTEHPEPGFAICVTQAPSISAGNQDYGGCFPVGGP
jgi:hypothetical protein